MDADFDIILVTAEYHEDHPFSASGVIARVLEAKGYSVGIMEKPTEKRDFTRLGKPKLCFAVTSGSVDSMVRNYTPLKKKRGSEMPDRAVILYCNKLREYFKGCFIVIGGVEASLRRFCHYDYWDNALRRSILLDSRADILVYGNGEKQIIEIAGRLKNKLAIAGIRGTCIIEKNMPENFAEMPSYEQAKQDKKMFCKSHTMFSNNKNLAQKHGNRYVLQYKYPDYTPEDIDWVYSLQFSRKLRKNSPLLMSRWSVVTHRGCFGRCSFCSIALHQGDKIISRSERSIIAELEKIAKLKEFNGIIEDIGGPSANMYGMDCREACPDCIKCEKLSHDRLIGLLRHARKVRGIKRIFIRSGIRYDLALKDKRYIKEIAKHHVSGCLKIAPEHFSKSVLKLMNKENSRFDEFLSVFNSVKGRQQLRYYFMICHPGENMKTMRELVNKAKKLRNIEQFQMFTPTPMTISSCMYWTGLNPFTLEKIDVVHDYKTKKQMKREFLKAVITN
jgi:uncharacterized radical SAM protein YgiQ